MLVEYVVFSMDSFYVFSYGGVSFVKESGLFEI